MHLHNFKKHLLQVSFVHADMKRTFSMEYQSQKSSCNDLGVSNMEGQRRKEQSHQSCFRYQVLIQESIVTSMTHEMQLFIYPGSTLINV